MNHAQIRKVEGVLATTLSCFTISLINTLPQGKHHVSRRNQSVERSLPEAADCLKDNTCGKSVPIGINFNKGSKHTSALLLSVLIQICLTSGKSMTTMFPKIFFNYRRLQRQSAAIADVINHAEQHRHGKFSGQDHKNILLDLNTTETGKPEMQYYINAT